MWSLIIHPDCLMNFLVAASGAIGSPSVPTSVIMNRPSCFFVGPRFVFFCSDDDPGGYTKTFIYLYSIHIDSNENMIFNTSKYSCDMYISTLFTSSVILNGWCLNSVTGHIQIYVGIAAIISLFGGSPCAPPPSAIIFKRNCSSSASVCCRGSIVTKKCIKN